MFKVDNGIITEKEQENDYEAYHTMEILLEKLKILNYEPYFLKDINMRPLHKYYFVINKNPGEQFYLFSLLATWLINKSGQTFEKPQEYDDPNVTISNILDSLRQFGVRVDFAPSKLKQGVGQYVVYVLDQLANQVLKKSGFDWKRLEMLEESQQESEIFEDDSEINLDRVEEEMLAAYSDESDEENIFRVNDYPQNRVQKQELGITSNTNQEIWMLELEKILPHLKVTIKHDNRDWRSHLDQMQCYKKRIEDSFNTTKNQLEKVHKDVTLILEKAATRERNLNRELDGVLNEYRTLQDILFKEKDMYRNLSGGVVERNRTYSKLTDKLESLKQQMENRGSSMTDGTPLINIKKAVGKIKTEIAEMDVRIGVLECIILQSKLHDKKMLEADLGHLISVF